MSKIFDSRDTEYKSPFGAAVCGATVRFAVRPGDENVTGVTLLLRREFAGTEHVVALSPGDDGRWQGVYTAPEEPELVWYAFRFSYPEGQRLYGLHGFDDQARWQLTVYDDSRPTPAWFGRGITYQIFPDRFCRTRVPDPAGMVGDRVVHQDWDDTPVWRPDTQGIIRNNDFFGGSLAGITSRLDYLQSMGVGTLYLCPIFESDSNHRYDTADYRRIDPMLGTEEDFRTLCREAGCRGIRVMLDGVFNHTGSNSRYFNAQGFYPELGAAQSRESQYYNWYSFHPWPEDYDAWWGVKTLPAVQESADSYRRFIIRDGDSVVRHWLRQGASGWRLDVADELPDDVLRDLRTAAKQADPDSVLLGEVWEDAVTKVSYGARRQYALGDALDSVMNYPLRDALILFLTGRSTARALADLLLSQRLNYPQPLYYALMNLTASHDVARTRSALALDFDPRSRTRAQLAALDVTDAMAARGAQLQPLAAAVQFWLPGIPSIYYGDEAGMQGLCDPFNRAPLQMCDTQMLQWYAKLSALRHAHPALQRGEIAVFAPAGDVVCILRIITGGHDAFGAEAEDEALLLAVNRAAHTVRCHVELTCPGAGLNEETRLSFVRSSYDRALECVTGARAAIHDGVAAFDLPPRSAQIYRLENRHGTETGS